MNTSQDSNMDKDANYKVLLTNYVDYAVVYNCVSSWSGGAIDEHLWILSRTNTMVAATYDEIKA